MPNVYCCVATCNSSTYQLSRWRQKICPVHHCNQGSDQCVCPLPFQLFPFPSQEDARTVWTKFVNRKAHGHAWKAWQPNKCSRICSKHFVDGRPSEENPNPTLNAGYEVKQSTGSTRKRTAAKRTTLTSTVPSKQSCSTPTCTDIGSCRFRRNLKHTEFCGHG